MKTDRHMLAVHAHEKTAKRGKHLLRLEVSAAGTYVSSLPSMSPVGAVGSPVEWLGTHVPPALFCKMLQLHAHLQPDPTLNAHKAIRLLSCTAGDEVTNTHFSNANLTNNNLNGKKRFWTCLSMVLHLLQADLCSGGAQAEAGGLHRNLGNEALNNNKLLR